MYKNSQVKKPCVECKGKGYKEHGLTRNGEFKGVAKVLCPHCDEGIRTEIEYLTVPKEFVKKSYFKK